MGQRSKNVCITWTSIVCSIFFLTTIILMSVMISKQPSDDVKHKYKEITPCILQDLQEVDCDTDADGCYGRGCKCYNYTFTMIDKGSKNCTFLDLKNPAVDGDGDELSSSDYSYEKIYYIYMYTQNSTSLCDPTVAKEYHSWIRLIITTSVFSGITLFLCLAICLACSCCIRCTYFFCSLDAKEQSEEQKPLYPSLQKENSSTTPALAKDKIQGDCGC